MCKTVTSRYHQRGLNWQKEHSEYVVYLKSQNPCKTKTHQQLLLYCSKKQACSSCKPCTRCFALKLNITYSESTASHTTFIS